MLKFIDSHTHLYLSDFGNDISDVMQRAAAAGVERFYLPAIDSSVTESLLSFEKAHPDKCFAMAGLHPCSVNGQYKDELRKVEEQLKIRSFAAIGEIGLDFYWSTEFSSQQYEVFETQMEWALQTQHPIVIHTRNAMHETIRCVRPFSERGLRGIFHCFGGSYEEAKSIIEMGFLLGIGGVLTYKKSGLDITMKQVGLEHVVLETDAPYLTPVPYRGKRNESSYIKIIAEKLAEIKNISLEEVAKVTTANAERIFNL
ncbi:MAG: TatD family hydrolase [Bacteroidetes bacterium]|nr:TatD family hydrolase [Bacteroidota bacterium]